MKGYPLVILFAISILGCQSQAPISARIKLSHGTKERLLDTFVYLMFHEKLPEYRIQEMGNAALDKQLDYPPSHKIAQCNCLQTRPITKPILKGQNQ